MSPDLPAIIAKLRRDQPRNPDTMALCDAVERLQSLIRTQPSLTIPCTVTFDRVGYHREYQRNYMRDARAAKKLGITTAEYRKRD